MTRQIDVNNKKDWTIVLNKGTLHECNQNFFAYFWHGASLSLLSMVLLMFAFITGAAQNDMKNEQNTNTNNPLQPSSRILQQSIIKTKQKQLSVNNVEAQEVRSKEDTVKVAEEYRDSLKELLLSYESEVKIKTEENSKIKELYAEGLVSQNNLETSDDLLAQAQAKVEDTRKKIAEAEAALDAAKKPSVIAQSSIDTVTPAESVEPVWTTGSQKIDTLVRYYGNLYGVDPYLIYCVIHQESGFRSGATSAKGAQGLMQLMPATAARFGVTNPYNLAQNIMAGTRYLKFLLELFDGRIDLALAGYNAGEGAVMKYGYRVPPYSETREYVRSISKQYRKNGGVTSPAATSQLIKKL